jgi:putative sigma-54 modulation protein
VNIIINARHMHATDAIREYAESKVEKFPKFYDNLQSAEVIFDIEAGQPTVEMVVTASRKSTFVAHHRDEDMYACVDQCVDKITQQLRRHKDKLSDHQATSTRELSEE